MNRLSRREMVKLGIATIAGGILSLVAGSLDLEEAIERLEQPTEEPTECTCEEQYSQYSAMRDCWFANYVAGFKCSNCVRKVL